MKLKKLLTICLTIVLSATMMTACSTKKDNDTSSGTSSGSSNTSNTGSTGSSSQSSGDDSGSSSTTAKTGLLSTVHDEIKAMFGEDYIPSQQYDEQYLEEQLGISSDLVKDFVAEGPMMSAHVDTFIGIEAAEGKAEEVEQKLNDYRQSLVDDSVQYPMNVPKIQASKVTRIDDYVFFTILGRYNDELTGEEELLKHYESETKSVVDKITDALK